MRKGEKGFIAIMACGLVLLVMYNLRHNCTFWDASCTSIISLIIALVVAFYFVQLRTDERKQKEIVEKLVDQIRVFALDYNTTHWPDSFDDKETLLKIRRIRNKIDILGKYSALFNYQQELNEIKKNFEKYEETVDEHQNDVNHLKQCTSEFCKWMDNINSRCDELIYKLYPAPTDKKKKDN